MKRTLSMALAALLILLALTPCALADGDALGAPLPSDMDEALSKLNERLAQSEEEYRLLAIQKRLTDIQNTRLLLENAQLLARIASLTEELNTVQAQLNVMTESYNANFAELAEVKDDLAYARRRVSSLSATVNDLQQYKEDLSLAARAHSGAGKYACLQWRQFHGHFHICAACSPSVPSSCCPHSAN